MVAETSESSKDHQSESATSENNTCTRTCTCVTSVNNTCECTCACRICNSWSVQKKRLFSVKNVLLCYKSNEQCLACVHPISGCTCASSISYGYLHALPTIRVHPELDGRTLDIVHSLTISPARLANHSAGFDSSRPLTELTVYGCFDKGCPTKA